jgi:hypothetical protein
MWRVAKNTLNKQLRTADRWLSSNLGVGRNSHSKIGIVTKHELLPWTWIDTLLRNKPRKMGH